MVKIQDDAIIRCPVENAWQFLSDVSNYPKWFQGTSEIRRKSNGPLAVGSTFEAFVQTGGISQTIGAQCIVASPDQEITWEFTSGLTKGSTDTWHMVPIDARSMRISRVFDLKLNGFWRLLQPLIVSGTRTAHGAEMDSVKQILEGYRELELGSS